MARDGERVAELRLSTLADSIAVRLLLAVMDPSMVVTTRLDPAVRSGLTVLRVGDEGGDNPLVAVVGDDETAFDRATWTFADAVGADVVHFLPRHTAELTELLGPVVPAPAEHTAEAVACRCGIPSSAGTQSG